MRFFNIDCHASVIEDIRNIFRNLGHDIVDWSLSGHAYVMGKQKKDIVLCDGTHFSGCPWATREGAKVFYETFREEFEEYDGFICCYPVEFCILYEQWNKPIIIVNCIRYEHPYTRSPERWNELNQVLETYRQKGLLWYVCNNKGDQVYTKYFTGIEGTWIPSLCEYTKCQYTPSVDRYLIANRSHVEGDAHQYASSLHSLPKNSEGRFDWKDIYKNKGLIHVPYHNGCMSIYEAYTANMPLFFPSKKFAKTLFHQGKIFQDLTFYRIYDMDEPSDPKNPNCLSNPENLDMWFDTCDFYDDENMPYCIYFDSYEHLGHLLAKTSQEVLSERSECMRQHNKTRRSMVYDKWSRILSEIRETL